ncbi:MBL fold metallo-hydrolase [Sulfurospirillum sp.]|nr:MBL fold metallo-hydrolase [Sulfurospirillum sp.]
MKKIILLITLPIFAFANFFVFKPVAITKDISCFIGDYNPIMQQNSGFVSNVCYIDIGKSLVLLDSGSTYNFAKELNEFIEKQTNKRIEYVVITNYHGDRLLGASFFKEKGVKIIGSSNMSEAIDEHSDKYLSSLKHLPKELKKGTKVIKPDLHVNKEYILKGSKKTIRIIKPSQATQTPTDLIVYSQSDSFIFTGNTVFNGRFINYADNSNIVEWIKALHVIKNLRTKYVMAGHGDDFSNDSYKPTLEYLQMLKQQVEVAYEKDIDPADLSKNIHTDEFKSIPHYEELYMRNARNYYNQLEWQ